jgi:hypothetical protein
MKLTLPLAFAFLVLFAMSGITAAAPPKRVGTMQVVGSNAFLNGQQVRTRDPVPINDGDYVSTGAATSVRIGLTADGYAGVIQLDENTDPNLIIATGCIIMRMLKGQALVNAKNICLGTTNISGVTRSVVNFKADATGGTVVTVIEGQLELQKPAPMTVAGSERLVALPDGTTHKYAIDAAEAARSTAWTQRYDFNKPETAHHDAHAGHVAAGVLGAILGGVVLCQAGVICNHDHDHDHGNDTPNDTPSPSQPQSISCCSYNDGAPVITPATAEECAAKGGTPYPTRQEAAQRCTVAVPADSAPAATVRCCKYNNGAPYPLETTVQDCSAPEDWVIKPEAEGQCTSLH